MKKLINKSENIVREMLEGIAFANPDVKVDYENQVVYKKNLNKDKVTLISGGGSGHEPAHAGYIAKGMLDAAVCGEVFTSPTSIMVNEAIELTKSNKGTLLIIKNYTGDVLNFTIAKDMASEMGYNVETVVVNDDVAVENSTYTAGRRGIAGTIFVHKIAGAAAEKGMSLLEVKRVAEKVINNVKSMGLSIGQAIVPSVGKASFTLEDDEIELGLGIHGEPGVKKEKMQSSEFLVWKLLDHILVEDDYTQGEVAILLNGLGGTPLMEQYIALNDARKYLESKNIKVTYAKVGNFMTALEMPGISISLLKLDSEIKELLLEKSEASQW
ncbi:dihydroxyacetone kinase subunit DhaK [Mycoplasmopsis agassizii]|uniref:Dihydroxyacetone kinase subunit DhaK n=1 Tax=Mycoplasmopsis agassizii TaxID=33922 RepID=A0A269TJP2_9BACT|nr:dihydroxyacetone kinase subunit DhaK [Mycoplasmopsis agassizii]PAK21631.1 dihydroxyacetone kinase subunit DhaK [Mycoplasmopsis agassizii]